MKVIENEQKDWHRPWPIGTKLRFIGHEIGSSTAEEGTEITILEYVHYCEVECERPSLRCLSGGWCMKDADHLRFYCISGITKQAPEGALFWEEIK